MKGMIAGRWCEGNDVLYIYHNRIDHTGDKMHSEGQVLKQ
jgi:hypothetical protein